MKNHRIAVHKQHVFKLPGSGRLWRGIGVAAVGLIILMVVFSGEKSIFKVVSLYQEREHLQLRINQLQQENTKMTEQIEALKTDPKAVEQIAREELGMVRSDELIYRFVPPRQHLPDLGQ